MPVVKNKRMFRGSARGSVFQTVDIGAGKGDYINRQSKKFPKRKYAAVDPLLYSTAFFSHNGKQMAQRGVAIGREANAFLDEMVQNHWKARHLNMDMPFPWGSKGEGAKSKQLFLDVLEKMPHVLLPNGKFYIQSESQEMVHEMVRVAKEKGFTARETKPIIPLPHSPRITPADKRYRTVMALVMREYPIYRMEITNNLRKVMPQKSDRQKYSGKAV